MSRTNLSERDREYLAALVQVGKQCNGGVALMSHLKSKCTINGYRPEQLIKLIKGDRLWCV